MPPNNCEYITLSKMALIYYLINFDSNVLYDTIKVNRYRNTSHSTLVQGNSNDSTPSDSEPYAYNTKLNQVLNVCVSIMYYMYKCFLFFSFLFLFFFNLTDKLQHL